MFSWPTNYDSCYTLAGAFSREGIGLHSGEKTKVTISSYDKEGYYVSFKDKPNKIYKLTQDLIGSTMLCTAVKLGGRNLYTIEHLLSSMAGCGLSYIHIEVDGKEIPLLDGSTISFSYQAIGNQTFVIDLNPKSFVEMIAPARTFGFKDQFQELSELGLIKGGSLENALVCDGDKWVNPPLRFDNEPIRHKILDLIGDLALVGLPKAQILVYKGSHSLNALLASSLKN